MAVPKLCVWVLRALVCVCVCFLPALGVRGGASQAQEPLVLLEISDHAELNNLVYASVHVNGSDGHGDTTTTSKPANAAQPAAVHPEEAWTNCSTHKKEECPEGKFCCQYDDRPPKFACFTEKACHVIEKNFTQSRFTARSNGFDAAFVVVLLAILVIVVLLIFCQGPSHTIAFAGALEEDDDDSDESVVAVGDGYDNLEWCDRSTSQSIIIPTGEVPEISLISPSWSSIALNNVFKECGLEKSWNEARSSKLEEELRAELSSGKSSFFAKSFTKSGSEQIGLKCVVYVMQLALHYVPGNLILQEFTHASDKNVFSTDEVRLPKTKIRTSERIDECFMRCLTLKLGFSQVIAEQFASSAVLLRANEEATTGSAAATISEVSTTVCKLTALIQLKDVDDKLLEDLGINKGSLSVEARGMEFRWEKVEEDYNLRRLLKKAPDARKVSPKWKPSGLAVLPWNASDVKHELYSRGVAPASCQGQDLPLLVQMLRNGQVQLGIEESSGALVCVQRRAYLKLSKKNGSFLVHKGNDATPACLPYTQVLANETPLFAALRVARSILGSVFMRVELQFRVQDVQSTSTPDPPETFDNFFTDGRPMKYVVREMLVEASAHA